MRSLVFAGFWNISVRITLYHNYILLPLHVIIVDIFGCIIADVQQQGWTVDSASRMLTVKKQPVVTEQKLDPSKLQRLTEYVFHLEHWSFQSCEGIERFIFSSLPFESDKSYFLCSSKCMEVCTFCFIILDYVKFA